MQDDFEAADDMAAMAYRAQIYDAFEEAIKELGGEERMFKRSDDGGVYVNTALIFLMTESFSAEGMKAMNRMDDSASMAYAHSATLGNVLIRMAHGEEANVPPTVPEL
jgi:hypothetical protein